MTQFTLGKRLEGKTAIITGGGGGIGSATAQMLAAHGANLVISDINLAGAENAVTRVERLGAKGLAVEHDVGSEASWKDVISAAVSGFGGIDILVNNAGLHRETSFGAISLAEWDEVLRVDLSGAFVGIREAAPKIAERGGGAIVNISSIAARIGGSFAHYSVAKAGMIALTRAAAIEFASQKVRVNTVLPGLIETDLTRQVLSQPELARVMTGAIPLPYVGQPEDIASAVLFLCSGESRFMTGAELTVDGGLTATAGPKLDDMDRPK
ncbi:short-chain dehydrogenase/reductase SDR [Hyphomonas adhaerens MHS-3]|uniref:Short-chain dehydrogenase/reductase SDR n=1 Tax=Hyphomonas adhaerens MHS-3 TaxID=1280949 RepID=A0A069E9J8_9PROT|nr:SDR family NAD(P)-dependent oxidoreductase [Hyphomonas adhaerens]KCZ86006.1 short-chain dehydrogenase/reductase SDR [Hyphomonas adhaerens MHS-3]